MRKDLYLPVEAGGITFKNPFFVASGPTTKSVKQLLRIEETGWAAASIKLTIDPAPYINRVPRYAVFEDRNALCFTAEKRLKMEEGLKLMDDAKKVLKELVLMANITYAGDRGVEGWVNMARRFEAVGADIIELNMCCPNMSFNVELSSGDDSSCGIRTGASLGQQGEAVAEIVREIKKNIKIPIFVKLTPEGGKIAQVAKAVYEAGADAVGGTSNRLGIPPINLKGPKKSAYHLQEEISMSCYSGAWLKPLALRDTYEMRKAVGPECKIMQAGGVRNYRDAVEMIMAGADLVGICAETLINGFDFIEDEILGLKKFMGQNSYKTVGAMRDLIVPEVKSAPELTLYEGYARISNPMLAAPCKAACPHHVPAQAYIQKVAKGDYRAAYDLITGKNPLQSVCAQVCSHPCEEACTRGEADSPVKIREIKKFVLEYGKKAGWLPKIMAAGKRNERIAVAGSGPAGLSCAYYLALAGYSVTVFEKEKYLGGSLRYGVPAFKMQQGELDDEIRQLKAMGIQFEGGKTPGRDYSFADLREQGYDAMFIAAGSQPGKVHSIPNANAHGVTSGITFLKDVYEGRLEKVSGRVVVCGDQLSALDVARTAKRLGAEEVYIACECRREEIQAPAEEIREAEEEGIRIMNLLSWKAVQTLNGKVTGITMANLIPGSTGALEHTPKKATLAAFDIPCEMVVFAEDKSLGGLDPAELHFGEDTIRLNDKENYGTNIDGVFAWHGAGRTDGVISAIAAGKRAACSIDNYIAGEKAVLEYEPVYKVISKKHVLKRSGYIPNHCGPDLKTISGAERSSGFDLYKRTLSEAEAVAEAQKCLNCGCGEGCGLCKKICSEFAVHVKEPDVLEINQEECVACGMCYNRCPNRNIRMINENIIVE